MQALSFKDSRQIRWHPLMIKWCLNVKLRSTSAYAAMRNSGFLKLPRERTLQDYTHWTKMTSGFQPLSFERLREEARYSDLEEWQKFFVNCSTIISFNSTSWDLHTVGEINWICC